MTTTAVAQGRRTWVPRGARLSEDEFRSRHDALSLLLLLHLPLLGSLALWWQPEGGLSGPGGCGCGWVAVGGLAAIVGLLAVGRVATSQAVRSAAVATGLILSSCVLVHISGGMTDLHLHFFVTVALVALYQSWVPFLLAIGIVAVHHVGMGLASPEMVFSDERAQANPIAFALLHAVLLLGECAALAWSWKYTERAEAARRAEQERAELTAAEQLRAQEALAAEQAKVAELARDELAARQERAAHLESRLVGLNAAGDSLRAGVGASESVMAELAAAAAEIDAAATTAATSADAAAATVASSNAVMRRLEESAREIADIARTITTIAEQTNLLALNATIEAARAGEAGRGFAVVAGEVKELATETARATELIERVVADVRTGTRDVLDSAGEIEAAFAAVSDAQSTISAASTTQRTAAESARRTIHDVAATTHQVTEEVAQLASFSS